MLPAVSWYLFRGEKDQAFEEGSALPEMNLSWELLAEMIKLAPGPLLLLYLVKCCKFFTEDFLLEDVVGKMGEFTQNKVANSRPLDF